MFCTKCGKELHEGDRFCSRCGAKVREEERLSIIRKRTKEKIRKAGFFRKN